jgi:hypothetical protein
MQVVYPRCCGLEFTEIPLGDDACASARVRQVRELTLHRVQLTGERNRVQNRNHQLVETPHKTDQRELYIFDVAGQTRQYLLQWDSVRQHWRNIGFIFCENEATVPGMGSREADHLSRTISNGSRRLCTKSLPQWDIQVVPCSRTLLPNPPPLLLVIL